MAELDLTNIFDDCVTRLANGQTVEDCLRRYPQYATTLRPMLETGLLIQRMRIQPEEVYAAQNRVRRRFEDTLRAAPSKRISIVQRFMYLAAAIVLISFIAVSSLTKLSENSLPGDALYGAKTLTENIQRTLRGNDATTAEFNNRRIDEINQLLALGRSAEVTFNGAINEQVGKNWTIASLHIQVRDDVSSDKSARLGDVVAVTAFTTADQLLVARTIQVIQPAPLPTPTLVATAVVLTSTPTPSPSSTPIILPTASPTLKPTQAPLNPTVAIPTAPILIATASATTCILTQPAGWVAYQIKSGDTLSALAASQSLSLVTLMNINCITDASLIVVGETIYLPSFPSVSQPTSVSTNDGSSNSGSTNSSPTDDHGGSDDNGGNSGSGDNSGHGSSNSGSGGGGNDG